MRETETFLKNNSLKSIIKEIDKAKNPVVKEALKCMKAQKMIFNNPRMDEELRVVKDSLLNFVGLVPYNNKIENLLESRSEIMTRGYAEYNSEYRQLVTNVLLHVRNKGEKSDLFGFLQRNDNYTEKSLNNFIGMVGGHCNIGDHNIYQGLIRELSEEIRNVPFSEASIAPLAVIRELGANISRQHLCVLYVMDLNENSKYYNMASNEANERLVWFTREQVEKELKAPSEECKFDSWARKSILYYLNSIDKRK